MCMSNMDRPQFVSDPNCHFIYSTPSLGKLTILRGERQLQFLLFTSFTICKWRSLARRREYLRWRGRRCSSRLWKALAEANQLSALLSPACPSSGKSRLLLSSHSLSCLCLLSGVPSSPLCRPVSCIPPPLTPLSLKARTRLIDRLTWGKVVVLVLLSPDQTCLSSPRSDSHFPFLPFRAP